YYFLPYRKRVICANMRRVFNGDLSDQQLKKLCCLFYQHFLSALFDVFKSVIYSKRKMGRCSYLKGIEHFEQAASENKGVLLLTGHFGSWEFGTIACISLIQNRLAYIIRKRIKNKFLEKILYSAYEKGRIKIIPKDKKSLLRVYRLLRKKQNIIFVLDQHASVKKGDGIMVEFFGEKCGTYQSLAALAKKTGAPVVPVCPYRDENGKYVLEFSPALSWQHGENEAREIYQNTLIYNQCLEEMVLEHPEQWLWSHRRWKGNK
ncbi:MAG: lysophospholipid acyltransferase family protein, partial [Pseudomonadota bacterium]